MRTLWPSPQRDALHRHRPATACRIELQVVRLDDP
jgi:hypothetical protein